MKTKRVTTAAQSPLALLMAAAVACSPQANTQPSPSPAPPPAASPAAADAGTTGTFAPDPNESPEAVERYQEARRLMTQGQNEEARRVLEEATRQFPESRHLHQASSEVLWYLSNGTDRELLRQSADQAVRAAELGLARGAVDYTLTNRLATTLGRIGDRATLDRIFGQLLARDSSSTIHLDYATGLALLGDEAKADATFQQALQADPNGDAAAKYGEWLLDRKRDQEALKILPEETPVSYIHFLRGVALERLGQTEQARAAYEKFREHSRTFPAPARFRIPGSTAQEGIRFADGNSA